MALAAQEDRTFFTTSVCYQRRFILLSQPFCDLLLDVFKQNRIKHRFELHEFVIMPNHLHVIVTSAADVSLEKAMQFIKGGFSFGVKMEMNCNFESAERIQAAPDQRCARLSRPC
jgi:putative transposase